MSWLLSTRFIPTPHAVNRFRQRIAPDGQAEDINREIRRSRIVGAKGKALIRQEQARHGKAERIDPDCLYSLARRSRALFVLRPLAAGVFSVVTCWRLESPENPTAATAPPLSNPQ